MNRLLRKKMHIVLTGSNAKLLSSDLATHLTGRSNEVPLYPFSFREYCEMKDVDTQTTSTKAEAFRRSAFDEYMAQGGFPEMMSVKNRRTYISHLVKNILERDIEQRYGIRYKKAFEDMAHHLLNVVPYVANTGELTNTFNMKSEHTVRNYISYLKEAYMLIGVEKFSFKSKMRMTQEKLYAVDVAMMDKRENAFAGKNLGWRLETIVLLELKRRCNISGLDVYYMKERSGECDFIICNGNNTIQAIQVSYDISDKTTRKREIDGLILAAKKTKCKDLLLLTDHEYEDATTEEGLSIKIRPVYNWAMQS